MDDVCHADIQLSKWKQKHYECNTELADIFFLKWWNLEFDSSHYIKSSLKSPEPTLQQILNFCCLLANVHVKNYKRFYQRSLLGATWRISNICRVLMANVHICTCQCAIKLVCNILPWKKNCHWQPLGTFVKSFSSWFHNL